MSTVILSAASSSQPSLQALASLLDAELTARGQTEVRTFQLANLQLAFCQGEFDCWVKTPGLCRAQDAEQDIVQAIHDAENLVLLDAVTFGGHSHILKRAQDRLICLISPFFEKRAALTHHAARYDHNARFFALGWMPVRDEQQVQTWNDLADANAVNTMAPVVGSTVVDDTRAAGWPLAIQAMLSSTRQPGSGIQARQTLTDALVASSTGEPIPGTPVAPRTAALLVGSAKIKGTSVSENLVHTLSAMLKDAGVTPEVHFATEFVHSGDKAQASATAIAAADLFLMVTPLYVDALPALVTHALELVAHARKASRTPAHFVPLINCGFPEPEHNRTAVRITRQFAQDAHYHFAGALPLGGGGAINPTVPLDQQHGAAEHVKRALHLAVPALARGENLPAEALQSMMKAPIPDVAYRVAGDLGWRYQAWQQGVAQGMLRARPLDPFG